jgi:hypothetical protein
MFIAMPGFSEELTQSQCEQRGGRLVSPKCRQGKDLGAVTGVKCHCRCCTGEKVVDCDKERITVTKICTTAKELRMTIRCNANSTASSFQFSLESQSWNGSIEIPKAKISCDKEIVTKYKPFEENKSFNKLSLVRAYFDDAVNICNWEERIVFRSCSGSP